MKIKRILCQIFTQKTLIQKIRTAICSKIRLNLWTKTNCPHIQVTLHLFSYLLLEGTSCNASLLLAPAEGFGQLCCPVVTLLTFSSNLSNLEENPPNKKTTKNPKKSSYPKPKKNPNKKQLIQN